MKRSWSNSDEGERFSQNPPRRWGALPRQPNTNTDAKSKKMDTKASLYNGNFPNFREPKEIGYFSIDSKRTFLDNRSLLRVYSPPFASDDNSNSNRHSFDLNKGYDKMIYKDPNVKDYLDNLLKWTMRHTDKFIIHPTVEEKTALTKPTALLTSLNTDFICWRGLLTRIMCLPYENREDLRVAVIKTRGTYFMCQFDTESKRQREETMTDRDKRMCAWGWKFEQYVTSDKPHGTPDPDRPVNNNEEFGIVVRSRLGSHSLVYGAEVDCTDPDRSEGGTYLELKTSRMIETARQNENFCRFKLIKFWAQSFLIGIRRIVCGFRNDSGIVHSLKDYSVKDIPKMAATTLHNAWSPSVCFNFLDSFLNFVKTKIPNNDERCVHVFYWKPGSSLIYEGHGDESFHFLPDWFLRWDKWDLKA